MTAKTKRHIVAGSFEEAVEIPYVGDWQEENVLKTRIRVHWGYELAIGTRQEITLSAQWVQLFILRNGRWFLYPFQVKLPSDRLYKQRDRAYTLISQSIQRRLLRLKQKFFTPGQEKKPRGVYHLAVH